MMRLLFFTWIISFFVGISHAQDCNIKFNEIRTINDEVEREWSEENKKYEEIYLALTDYIGGGGIFPNTVTVEMDVESNCGETEKVMVLMEIFPQEGDAPPYNYNYEDDPCAVNFNYNEGRRQYAVAAIYSKEIEVDVENKKTLIMSNTPVEPLFHGLQEGGRWYWKLKYVFTIKTISGEILSVFSIERESPLVC